MATMTMATMTYDMSLNHRDTLYNERTGMFLALRDSIFIPKAPVGRDDVINLIGKNGIKVFRREYSISFNDDTLVYYHFEYPRQYVLEVYSKYEDLNKRWAELRMGHDHR